MAPHEAKPRVLVVDDEEPNLETFKRVFRADFEIMLATSVELGMALVRAHDFDIALVDYAMPIKNGVVFLHEAAVARPEMTRMMLTAHGDLDEVKRAYDGGLAHAIIMKPWDRASILRWVTNALRMKSLKRTVSEMRLQVEKK